MFANHHICMVLQSSVRHTSGLNCLFMHKSKYIEILVRGIYGVLIGVLCVGGQMYVDV